jgi:hypothetical protein
VKLFISVCKNTILHNIKRAKLDLPPKPPLRISLGKYGKPSYAHEVPITGQCVQCGHEGPFGRVVYSPGKPLPWGARAWIELFRARRGE